MTELTCDLTICELTVTSPFIKCAVHKINKFYSMLLYICITYKLSINGYSLYRIIINIYCM